MAKPPQTRSELDERLRKSGLDAGLYKDDEQREKAKWAEKQLRAGKLRKTVRWQ